MNVRVREHEGRGGARCPASERTYDLHLLVPAITEGMPYTMVYVTCPVCMLRVEA